MSYNLSPALNINKIQRKSTSVEPNGYDNVISTSNGPQSKFLINNKLKKSLVSSFPRTTHGTAFISNECPGRTQTTAKNYSIAQNARYHKRIKSDYMANARRLNKSPEKQFEKEDQAYGNIINLKGLNKVQHNSSISEDSKGTNITANTNIIFIEKDKCKINVMINCQPDVVLCKKQHRKLESQMTPNLKLNWSRIKKQHFSVQRSSNSEYYNNEGRAKIFIKNKRSISDVDKSNPNKINKDKDYSILDSLLKIPPKTNQFPNTTKMCNFKNSHDNSFFSTLAKPKNEASLMEKMDIGDINIKNHNIEIHSTFIYN